MSRRECLIVLLLIGAQLALWAHHPITPTASAMGTPGQAPDLPPGPVQAKARTACLECHDAGIIVQQRLSKGAWTKEVDKMIRWGAVVAPDDRDAFIDYFAANFGTDKPPATPQYGAATGGKAKPASAIRSRQ